MPTSAAAENTYMVLFNDAVRLLNEHFHDTWNPPFIGAAGLVAAVQALGRGRVSWRERARARAWAWVGVLAGWRDGLSISLACSRGLSFPARWCLCVLVSRSISVVSR